MPGRRRQPVVIELTASSVLSHTIATLEQLGVCAGDTHERADGEASEKSSDDEQHPKEECCTGESCCIGSVDVELSSEEKHIVRWFRESHALAKDAIEIGAADDEPFEWVDMPVDDSVAVVTITQKRMQEIGLVYKNGQLPTLENPAHLFWIQAKPDGKKEQFGLWDPVGAQWKLFPGRTLVPIEQRIAPCRVGCCGYDEFTDADYGDGEVYTGTALEAALPHVRKQVRALPAGTRVPAASGWGFSEHSPHAYYTPHLRHVVIDRSVPEAGGKKYVYKFPPRARVVPMEGKYEWNATNTCWVYHTEAPGRSRMLPNAPGVPFLAEYSEQQRDTEMARSA